MSSQSIFSSSFHLLAQTNSHIIHNFHWNKFASIFLGWLCSFAGRQKQHSSRGIWFRFISIEEFAATTFTTTQIIQRQRRRKEVYEKKLIERNEKHLCCARLQSWHQIHPSTWVSSFHPSTHHTASRQRATLIPLSFFMTIVVENHFENVSPGTQPNILGAHITQTSHKSR